MVQSGFRRTLQANWIDSGLFARAAIYNNTTGTPVLITSVNMSEWLPGMYQASFVPSEGISYLVAMRVYTDGTYTTLDPNYAPASVDFQSIDFARVQKVPIVAVVAELAPQPTLLAIAKD